MDSAHSSFLIIHRLSVPEIQLTFWRVEYVSMITQLTNPNPTSFGQCGWTYTQKYGAFHHLNLKITQLVGFGLSKG